MAFTEVIDKAGGATVTGAEFNTYVQANLNTGLWVPLAQFQAAGGETTVTFAAIPQDFYGIVLLAMLRSTGGSDNASFRFNGDTGTNYHTQRMYSGLGAAGAADEFLSNTNTITINMPPSTAPTATFGPLLLEVMDYANAALNKHGFVHQGSKIQESAGAMYAGETSIAWSSNSPITSLSVSCTNGFAALSTMLLYGIGGML